MTADESRHPTGQGLSRRGRYLLSLLIVAHLLAVAAPPLSFQAVSGIGSSPSVATVMRWVEPYSQFCYLDRGYAFFAPDPGPSHLFQAAITAGDGTVVEEMYPDLQNQWPRLLYHRHFMLAEYLAEIYQPPGPPPELARLNPTEADVWTRARARYERVRMSIAGHLEHVHPGQQVAIRRIEHLIPTIAEFQAAPVPLNDQRLYTVMLDRAVNIDGSVVVDQLPETVPPPDSELDSQAGEAGLQGVPDDRAATDEPVETTTDNASTVAEPRS